MKKIIITMLACAMLLSVSACGSTQTETSTEQAADTQTQTQSKEEKTYAVGETWTVDGQWELTVNSVTATDSRNEFADKTPGAVYIVDYSYTNTGYTDQYGIMDGLYFDLSENIIDSTGVMGYSYPGDITSYPQEAPVGATCNAQACIGVDNAGDFKLNVTQYDGNGEKQSATFDIAVQ